MKSRLALLFVGLTLGAGLASVAIASGDSAPSSVQAAANFVRVPNVIGRKPRTADRILTEHHLRHHYKGLSNACAGRPPQGHILDQAPDPGKWVRKYALVLLHDSCGR